MRTTRMAKIRAKVYRRNVFSQNESRASAGLSELAGAGFEPCDLRVMRPEVRGKERPYGRVFRSVPERSGPPTHSGGSGLAWASVREYTPSARLGAHPFLMKCGAPSVLAAVAVPRQARASRSRQWRPLLPVVAHQEREVSPRRFARSSPLHGRLLAAGPRSPKPLRCR